MGALKREENSKARPRATRGTSSPPKARRRPAASADEIVVPVLASRADPGRTVPSPMAIRDRLLLDRSLLDEHGPDRLFAYEVTPADMKHLRGLARPGDHVVFRRGGRATEDRICAVRTDHGVVLSRVLIRGDAVVLLPGLGLPKTAPPVIEGLEAQRGVIAGTHLVVVTRR